MKQNDFEISIRFQGKQYSFAFGSQAYIFHTGILNGFFERYGIDKLLQYTDFVHRCYLKNDNRTPLGALADYISENWESVRDKPAREVLEDFYYWTT